jgi:hypothetical protein
MFSATGTILTGSQIRPDIYTIATNEGEDGYYKRELVTTLSTMNKVGYIPGVSTITGCGRALLGLVHSIVHLVSALFDSKNRSQHLEEAKLGRKNIARGLVEMIPVIGNITMLVVDTKRMIEFTAKAIKIMESNPRKYNNHITLFAYGKELGKKTTAEYDAALEEFDIRKMTTSDLVNVITA